jgi:cation diffusion facilitator family transporter
MASPEGCAANNPGCARCAKAVPWFSFWGNLSLAIYKLVIGVLGGSTALVADALHSFADVVGSGAILVSIKASSRQPDKKYPYGCGKAEFVGAAFVYTVLTFFALGIIIGSVRALFEANAKPPHIVTAVGALVSVLYNYTMYRYATCVGRRNNSPAILADAFENRADAQSSVAAIVGIVGAILIHPVADALAALIVGFQILWNCQEQLRTSVRGLMDGGMPAEDTELVERLVSAEAAVERIVYIRTRQTGVRYWLDVCVAVAGDLAVHDADELAARLRTALRALPFCHHVEVYVQPVESDGILQGTEPVMAPGGE